MRFLGRGRYQTAAPFQLALLLLALSLGIMLAGGWMLYSLLWEAREDAFDRRLLAIARASEPSVADAAEIALLTLLDVEEDQALPEDDSAWREWFESLAELPKFPLIALRLGVLRENAGLSSALLISRQKRVIADGTGQLQPGTLAPLVDVDLFVWEPAIEKRRPGSVPYYEINGAPHKRFYLPIVIRPTSDAKPVTAAVLRLEASLDVWRDLARYRNQSITLAGVVAALLGIVALLFFRLIRLFARIQATAAHRDRLEAMGLLTAGIAHEIRNPLGIIRTLAEALADDPDQPAESQEMARDIVGEVERLNRLVQQYLTFARPEIEDVREAALPVEVIREAVQLVQKSEKGGPEIRLEIEPHTPAVAMHPNALKQIVLNLLLNAREASPEDGPIVITCRTARPDHVEITVRDQGRGLTPREQRRVFEPFYTTKTRGSGLGLAICRRLVSDAGGTIDLESEIGKGTTLKVNLPAART
ncbi:hypothetical protein HQ520_15520 [bacterium]|nr:hypothetical protein [bacterium]